MIPQMRQLLSGYNNVLTGLVHGLVHTTGDYPVTNYRQGAMIVNFFAMMIGMCVTGAFTGIFCAGFTNYLSADRKLERKLEAQKRMDFITGLTLFMQRKIRRHRRRKQAQQSGAIVYDHEAYTMYDTARGIVRRKTLVGKIFMGIANAALVINVANTLVGTIPEIEEMGRSTCIMNVLRSPRAAFS